MPGRHLKTSVTPAWQWIPLLNPFRHHEKPTLSAKPQPSTRAHLPLFTPPLTPALLQTQAHEEKELLRLTRNASPLTPIRPWPYDGNEDGNHCGCLGLSA